MHRLRNKIVSKNTFPLHCACLVAQLLHLICFISLAASQVPEERFTPLHFFKPHIGACFTASGSCIITNPNDPREDQVPSLLFVPSKVVRLFRGLITLGNFESFLERV